jgi:hypothetical protein
MGRGVIFESSPGFGWVCGGSGASGYFVDADIGTPFRPKRGGRTERLAMSMPIGGGTLKNSPESQNETCERTYVMCAASSLCEELAGWQLNAHRQQSI